MKARIHFIAAAAFVIVSGAGLYVMRRQPWFLSDFKFPAPLWNAWNDAELKFFAPQTTFNGSINRIEYSLGKLSLSQPRSRAVWIAFDAEVRKKLREGTIDEGDLVTVVAKQQYRSDRSGIEWKIRSIEVDSFAFRRPRPIRNPSDFSEPVEFSLLKLRIPISSSKESSLTKP
jgi:hypothetical protein